MCVHLYQSAEWKGDPEAMPEGCSVDSNMPLTVSKCFSTHSHGLNLHSVTHIQVHEFESIVEAVIKVNTNKITEQKSVVFFFFHPCLVKMDCIMDFHNE